VISHAAGISNSRRRPKPRHDAGRHSPGAVEPLRALGRVPAVTFHNETIAEAYASRAAYGVPDWQADAWVSTYTAIASDIMAAVSRDIETITGEAPMNLETYLRRNPR